MSKFHFHTFYKVVSLALAFGLTACDATIHQYPEPEHEIDFVVQLNCDRTPPPFYKEIAYDADGNRTESELEENASPSYMPDDRLTLRFVVEIRDNNQTDAEGTPQTVARREVTVDNDALPPQAELHFSLPSRGEYTAVSWCDYVPVATGDDWHFDTSTLDFVQVNMETQMQELHHKNSGTGYSRFGIDWNGVVQVTSTTRGLGASTRMEEGEEPSETVADDKVPVYMTRPAGRLRLYTDDLAEFRQTSGMDIEDVQVVIVYKQFVSAAYDALEQAPCQWVSTRRTVTHPSVVNETGNVCLAYDYILVDSEEETHVLADFYFLDADGNELSHTTNVDVPLMRNRETVIRSRFLTQDIGEGGLNVDEGFDDEYVIVVP